VTGDLSGLDPLFLEVRPFLGDLAEGPIEDRHVVLDAEPHVRILVEGPLAGRIDVVTLQHTRLGEGLSAGPPHPPQFVARLALPSPARAEGAIQAPRLLLRLL
jgi:hypothetical protein